MAQSYPAIACGQIATASGQPAPPGGCAIGPAAMGREAITVIDQSWGLPWLGPDGTLALGAMAIAAATITTIAWRVIAPAAAPRR